MTNILVVDDDEDVLEMVTRLLMVEGMNVCSMNSAESIVESIGHFGPGLILMDIYLGNQDGRKVCLALKTAEEFRHIPVILYSAGDITAASVKEAQADAFISKPFDMYDLFEKIRSLAK